MRSLSTLAGSAAGPLAADNRGDAAASHDVTPTVPAPALGLSSSDTAPLLCRDLYLNDLSGTLPASWSALSSLESM